MWLSRWKGKDRDVVEEAEYLVTNRHLRGIIKTLEAENKALRNKTAPVDIKMSDPSPNDTEKRQSYVAEVAGFHKKILEPKLKQMISSAQDLLSNTSNSRDEDLALKGSIYAFWELIYWGESMVNEQLANQTKENNKE